MSVVSQDHITSRLPETDTPPTEPLKVGLLRRFGFRLVFTSVFFYLWTLFVPGLWEPLVTWTGTHFFHADITQEFTGSGDTAYNWVMEADCLALALPSALLWTPFDRSRKADARLGEWMRIAVRFGLATQLLVYGIMKVIPTQFSTPRLTSLSEPLGDHSPMGLLWAFMGTSAAYTIFAGSIETLGGLLLLSRRTTLLGALVSAAAMSNVVVLNFCYDVPVKLFSTQLLLLAVLLAAPEVGRLVNVFLLNRPAPPVVLRPHSARRWVNWLLLGVKLLLFGALIYFLAMSNLDARRMFAPSGTPSPLTGIWNVDEPAAKGLPEADRWRQIGIDPSGMAGLTTADGTFNRYRLSLNTAQGTLTLALMLHPRVTVIRLTYTRISPNEYVLHGAFNGYPLQATLIRQASAKPPLLSRGFHWISPFPFNR